MDEMDELDGVDRVDGVDGVDKGTFQKKRPRRNAAGAGVRNLCLGIRRDTNSLHFGHLVEQFDAAAGVAPLVVVPREDLD